MLGDNFLADQGKVASVALAVGPDLKSFALFKGDSLSLRVRHLVGSGATHFRDHRLLNEGVLHHLMLLGLHVLLQLCLV